MVNTIGLSSFRPLTKLRSHWATYSRKKQMEPPALVLARESTLALGSTSALHRSRLKNGHILCWRAGALYLGWSHASIWTSPTALASAMRAYFSLKSPDLPPHQPFPFRYGQFLPESKILLLDGFQSLLHLGVEGLFLILEYLKPLRLNRGSPKCLTYSVSVFEKSHIA